MDNFLISKSNRGTEMPSKASYKRKWEDMEHKVSTLSFIIITTMITMVEIMMMILTTIIMKTLPDMIFVKCFTPAQFPK